MLMSNGPATAGQYACFDFRMDSDIVLGELAPARDERPSVAVRLGQVAETLDGATVGSHGLQVAGRTALLHVPDTARYLIREGREIVVQPLPGASERNVRLFLLGSALGVLCFQRGLLLLHANAIAIGSGVVAFSGSSGAGKSTLAAWFAHRGYPVLCDDVCAVRVEDGRVTTWPGLPRLKLWGEAATAFGHDPAALDVAIEGMDKYHVPVRAMEGGATPLRELNLLARAEPGDPVGRIRLNGAAAMAAVMAQTYRGEYLEAMGLSRWHFEICAALARAIPVFTTPRIWGYDRIDAEGCRLEAAIRGQDGG